MSTTNTCMGVYQFDDESKRIFKDIVKPLIETHTGLTYVDGMSHYEPSNIKMDLISRLISEANLIIIDVSYKNPNVFLELGMAYTAKKPIVFVCSEKQFNSRKATSWNRKMPFDIEGRELLVFKNDNDLKVKLGRFISDSLFKTCYITVPWYSTNPLNHVKSANELHITKTGFFWSNVGINHNFIMSYHVIVHEFDSSRNPDTRLFFSNVADGYPRLAIIFPWEGADIDSQRYECHIDYLADAEPKVDAKRLQQISVCEKKANAPFEFDVSLSFYQPNLVFESSLFEDKINRLVVPINHLRDLGYSVHQSQYVGFGSGHKITISNILIKEVFI